MALAALVAGATDTHQYKSAKDEPRPDLAYVVIVVYAPLTPDAEFITVEPVPVEDPDKSTGFKLERVKPKSKYTLAARAYYAGAIPAGRYRIDAFPLGSGYSHIKFTRSAAAEFDAVAGKRADLATLQISGFTGMDQLAYRVDLPEPDAEALAHEAPALISSASASLPRTGWREPIGDDERALAREDMKRLHGLNSSAFVEGLDGTLWLAADAGRLLRRSRDGRWHVVQAPQPMLIGGVDALADGSAIVVDERMRRWRVRGDRFERLDMSGFTADDRILRCDKDGCLAVRAQGKEEIVLSILPAGAEAWREIARGKARSEDVLGGERSISVLGGRWYFEFGTDEIWAIDMARGVVERKPYPHRGRRVAVLDGKLVAWKVGNAERFSADGGASWQELGRSVEAEQATAGFRDARTGFVVSDVYFAAPVVFTDASPVQTLMGTVDGGVTWSQMGTRPVGRLLVSRTSDLLFVIAPKTLSAHLVVYVSKDDGKTWQMEDITYLPSTQEATP